MSRSRTFAAWRTGGLWPLLWLKWWWTLTNGRNVSLLPRGFVGGDYGSLAGTDLHRAKLTSIRLHRTHYTPDAPPWRLICVWEVPLLPSRNRSSGDGWEISGRVGEGDGADISRRLI